MASSSSSSIIRYLEEVTPGTIETGNPQTYRVLSGALNQSIETNESQELRADRGRSETTLVSGSVGGSINIDWYHATHDDFLEALLAGTYTEAGTNGVKTVADMVFTAATHTISSAANNLPLLEKGQWFKIGSGTTGKNGIYKASSSVAPTTGAIVVDTAVKDTIDAVEASTVISAARLKQGNADLRSFTIERELSDANFFFTWAGCYVGSLNLTFADKAAVTGNFGFIAKESERTGTTSGFPSGVGSAVAANTNPRFNSVSKTTVLIDGTNMADSCITSMTLDINANLRERRCLGSGLAASSIGADQFTISANTSIYFGSSSSQTLYGKKIQGTPIEISMCVTDSEDNGFAITLKGTCTDGAVDAGAMGSDVVMSMNISSYTNTDISSMIAIDRLGTTA